MKTIHIMHLVSGGGLNYIVEIDNIEHRPGFFNKEVTLTGYIVDSNNPHLPTGEHYIFTVTKWPSTNLLHPEVMYSSDHEIIEECDTIQFPNWFERLFKKNVT